MNLYDFFEECSLEKQNITDQFVYEITNQIPASDLIKITNKWLVGISNKHQIPGKVILTMQGICDFYRECHDLTPKQRVFVINNLIRYWDQINCESRANMML
jgi:hypothetical protein